MIDDASPEPRDSGTPSAQAPESYFWPLVALVLVILPQVLVPGRLRDQDHAAQQASRSSSYAVTRSRDEDQQL